MSAHISLSILFKEQVLRTPVSGSHLGNYFGSDECLKQDWANGTLLPTTKRKQNDDEDDNDNAEADEGNSKDVVETIYKPDWAVFANGNPVITVIGTLELKAKSWICIGLCEAGKRNEVSTTSINTSWCGSTYCLWNFNTKYTQH
ncbi:hypothetical protein A0J61_04943 [Choanephora cucurbitarum]|uniref:Uncharacterized protein n=1 Tax=Choanephora cucurbitarum TaxID=101091 RepID=A0A1C7ND59_9FUNG|nr:hypothetical protein A0J61_04943 [Choanephora cucurbitarum]